MGMIAVTECCGAPGMASAHALCEAPDAHTAEPDPSPGMVRRVQDFGIVHRQVVVVRSMRESVTL